MSTNDQCLTIRSATRSDIPAIAGLAELDSAPVPRGRVLLAEQGARRGTSLITRVREVRRRRQRGLRATS